MQILLPRHRKHSISLLLGVSINELIIYIDLTKSFSGMTDANGEVSQIGSKGTKLRQSIPITIFLPFCILQDQVNPYDNYLKPLVT